MSAITKMLPKQYYIQMSGTPSSGKTTLATALSKELNAVIIDHDITKTALLISDIPTDIAGKASYNVLYALAPHLLRQGHSVIFDNPCLYDNILIQGQAFAKEAGAEYRYIECQVKDFKELDRRLRTRESSISQIDGIYKPASVGSGKGGNVEKLFIDWQANMKRPPNYLLLDMLQDFNLNVDTAMDYVSSGKVVL